MVAVPGRGDTPLLLIAPRNRTIRDRLAADLAEVESRFAAELRSDLPCVNRLVTHIESYRGKMLRPTLVLVSAMGSNPQGGANKDAHRIIAAVVEMVHMATLAHDDILDDAEIRRGGTTINSLVGNESAVMLGDYLISHAYHLCSDIGRTDICRMIAESTNVTCEGELLQLANRGNWFLDEQTYFEIIRRKTACLCGICCKIAAVLSGTTPATAAALYRYGQKLGTAFQIVDDVLDLTSDEQTTGKTVGRDLQKGKLTLPLIHCLSTVCPDDQTRLHDLLQAQGELGASASTHTAAVDQIRRYLADSESVAYAQRSAGQLIADAKQAVMGHLAPSAARSLMLDMADAVLTRDR